MPDLQVTIHINDDETYEHRVPLRLAWHFARYWGVAVSLEELHQAIETDGEYTGHSCNASERVTLKKAG